MQRFSVSHQIDTRCKHVVGSTTFARVGGPAVDPMFMVSFDQDQAFASCLQAVEKRVGLSKIFLIVRLFKPEGRRMDGELPTIEQVAQANDQIRPDRFGDPADDLDRRVLLVRDMDVAKGENRFKRWIAWF